MDYAHVVGGVVRERLALPHDIDLPATFSAEFLAELHSSPPEVQPGWTFDGSDWAPPVVTLAMHQARVVAEINARVAACLAAGAPYAGERIALDDGALADLGSMATTALAAQAGSVPWPESYALGWISIANVRLPMATPEDGLLLAAAAGDCYARIVQAGRSLKDAALSAPNEAALDAIDIDAALPLPA